MYKNLTYNFIVGKQKPFIVHRAVDILQKQYRHWLLSLCITVSNILFSWQLTRVVLARREETTRAMTQSKKIHSGGLSGDSAMLKSWREQEQDIYMHMHVYIF